MSVRSIASGSSGNAILVRAGETTLLVDCGLSAKQVVRHLTDLAIDPRSVDAILLTHEHTDHTTGAGVFSRKFGTPIISNRATLDACERSIGRFERRPVARGEPVTIGTCEVASFPVTHDAAEPCGFLIEYAGWCVAVCIDLGKPDDSLHDPLSRADLLIVESNHDYDKLRYGPYSPSLKARLLSDHGHLSNLEAARLIAGSSTDKPRTVWLAHLSAENNTPLLAKRIVGGFLRRQRIGVNKLEVALRDRPSLAWSTDEVGWQLPLPV